MRLFNRKTLVELMLTVATIGFGAGGNAGCAPSVPKPAGMEKTRCELSFTSTDEAQARNDVFANNRQTIGYDGDDRNQSGDCSGVYVFVNRNGKTHIAIFFDGQPDTSGSVKIPAGRLAENNFVYFALAMPSASGANTKQLERVRQFALEKLGADNSENQVCVVPVSFGPQRIANGYACFEIESLDMNVVVPGGRGSKVVPVYLDRDDKATGWYTFFDNAKAYPGCVDLTMAAENTLGL